MFKISCRRGSKRQTAYAFKGFPAREPIEFSRNCATFRRTPRNVKPSIAVTLNLLQPLHSGHQRTRNEQQRLDETDVNHDAFICAVDKKRTDAKWGNKPFVSQMQGPTDTSINITQREHTD